MIYRMEVIFKMTNTRRYSFNKKALSIVLTVVMVFGYVGLLSGVFGVDLFGTKVTADAATAGKYYVKITWHVDNEGYSRNAFTHADDYSGDDNNMGGIQLYYKTNNGTGETYKAWWDVGHEYKYNNNQTGSQPAYPADSNVLNNACGTTLSGDSASMDIHYWTDSEWNWGNRKYYSYIANWHIDDDENVDHCLYATISGFPTRLYAIMDYNMATTAAYRVTKIEVGKNTSSYTTVWSGTGHLASSSKLKYINIYASGQGTNGGNDSKYGYVSGGSDNWQMPYVNTSTVTINGDTTAAIALEENGTASKSYSVANGVKDQYGVAWGPDPTWTVSGGGSSNSGSTVTFANGTGSNVGKDYTATVKASFATANSGHNPVVVEKTVTVSARHTLTIKPNQGVWENNSNDQTFYGHTGDTKVIVDPERTAYDFVNWTVDGGSFDPETKKYTFADRNLSTMTANWTPHTYTAVFKADDIPDSTGALHDSTNDSSANYNIEGDFTFPTGLSKDYYTFDNVWKVTGSTGASNWTNGATYTGGSTSPANKYGEVTFRAQYTPVDYLITFNPNGGAAITSNYDAATNTNHYKYNYECRPKTAGAADYYEMRDKLPAATWLGWRFAGWQPKDSVGNWDASQTYPANYSLKGMHGNVELKAKWETETSKVYLNIDTAAGESIDGGTEVDYAFSTALTLNNPTKNGWNFTGWKVTTAPTDYASSVPGDNRWTEGTEYSLGQETNVVLPAGKIGNVTLTPMWEHVKYTITYAGNNGTTPDDKEYYIDSAAFNLPGSTRDGYDFDGWTLTAHDEPYNWTASSYAYNQSISGKYGNVTLTAQWLPHTYTITLLVNGGDALANTTLPYKITESTSLPTPTRTGYTFTGWKVTSPGANTSWTADDVFSGESPAAPAGNYGNLTLTAQWEHTKYTISLGGSGTPEAEPNPIEYYIDSSAFTLGGATRGGYSFANWTVDANVGNWVKNAVYNADTSISGMWGNVNLTAHYTPKTYHITYQDGEGEGAHVLWEDENTDYTIEDAVTLRTYAAAGYTFGGWKVASVGTDHSTLWQVGGTFGTSDLALSANQYYGDVTLVPLLTPKGYTITFDFNGAPALIGSMTYTIESTGELPGNSSANPPAKTGHDFAGWKVVEVGDEGNWTKNDVVDGNTALTGKYGSVTLQAQWTPKNYTITYITGNYPDGVTRQGTYGQSTPNDLTDEEKGKPADAQYTYTFDHWDPALAATVTGEATYTAVYTSTVNKYVVTWMIPEDVGGTPDNYTGTNSDPIEYGQTPVYNNGVNPTMVSADPARYSWRFNGWSLTPGGTVLEGLPAVTGAATYYANFTSVLTPEEVDWVIGETHNVELWGVGETPRWEHDTPTKADADGYKYVFTGWYPEIVPVVDGTSYTYTAQFDPVKQDYTISLSLNGGSMSDPLTMGYQRDDVVTFPAPTKTGYEFAGWLLDAAAGTWAAGTLVDADHLADYATTGLWGNVSFTAQWTVKEYTIHFASEEEGVVLPNDMTYTIQRTDTLPTTATREGHTQTGWTVSVGDGNWRQGDLLAFAYTLNENYGNVTLTPVWQVNIYDITWKSNDEYAETSQAEYGSAILAHQPLAKAGYTAAWDQEIPATMPAHDLIFTAEYTPVQYYVRLYVNGGSAVDNFYYTIESGSTLPTPTRDGAAFMGWKVTNPSGNWVRDQILAGGVSLNGKYGNVSLTAQWELETRIVTWVAGDVTKETVWQYGAMPSYDGTPYKAPDESYSYVFTGWDKEILPVTEDVTYTAQFERTDRKYTVIWNVDGATITEYYNYGATPVYPGESDPARISTSEYDFTFIGWSPAVGAVTGDVTYTAQFDVFTKLQGLSIDVSSLFLNIGENHTVVATISPANATVRDVVWTSRNTEIATISQTGEITAVSPGIALINVSSPDKSFNAYCVVTVAPIHTSYLEIKAGGVSTTQLPGAMLQLSAVLQPDNATDTGIRWSSGDLSVATVDSTGLVRFVNVGETDIVAVASDGFSLGSIHVVTTTNEEEVEDNVTTYRVTFGDFATGFRFKEDGEVYKTGYCSVPEGETLRFKLNVADGKQANYSVLVNGNRISYGDDYWYALEDVHENMVISLRSGDAGSNVPQIDIGGNNGNMGFFQRLAAFFRKIVEFFRGLFNK